MKEKHESFNIKHEMTELKAENSSEVKWQLDNVQALIERTWMEKYFHANIHNFKAYHSIGQEKGRKIACPPWYHITVTADWS